MANFAALVELDRRARGGLIQSEHDEDLRYEADERLAIVAANGER